MPDYQIYWMPIYVVVAYWAMALLTGLALVYLAACPFSTTASSSTASASPTKWYTGSTAFCAVVLLCLLSWRWPSIAYPRELNPDESLMIVQATAFMADPVPWRSVDSASSGPLNSYVLIPPAWLGFDFSFAAARSVAVLCIWGAIVGTFFTLRSVGDEPASRLAVTPATFFFASATTQDYVHYSSELLSVLLISIALSFACAAIWQSTSLWKLFVSGICLGAVPFAKLQAGPIAVVLFATVLLIAVYKLHRQQSIWRITCAMCAGGAVIPAGLFAVILANGQFEHFWNSYILTAGTNRYAVITVQKAVSFWTSSDEFMLFSAGGLLTIVILLVYRCCQSQCPPRTDRCFVALVLVYFTVAMTSIIKPARITSYHYFTLAVMPITLVSGIVLLPFCRTIADELQRCRPIIQKHSGVVAAICILWIWLFVLGVERTQNARRHPYLNWIQVTKTPHQDAALKKIKSLELPNDRIAVWGWAADFYMRVGMLPATRDVTTARVIDFPSTVRLKISPELMQYYHQRYLDDLTASMPAIFVDAVCGEAFEFQDRARHSHEQIPELKAFIDKHYELVLDTADVGDAAIPETMSGDGLRVYSLKPERHRATKVK